MVAGPELAACAHVELVVSHCLRRALTARSTALRVTSGCVRQGPGKGEWLCAYTDEESRHLLSGPLNSVGAMSIGHTAGDASYFELNQVRGKPWCSGSIRAQD